MADDLKAGDVVQLKSGGPKMTIEEIDTYDGDHNKASCVWFEKNKREESIFELTSLVKAPSI
jgi:uncharacterized protein YodC (DUF2158 family)